MRLGAASARPSMPLCASFRLDSGTGKRGTRTGRRTRWPQEVSSYAIDDGERLVFFDPLAVPDELLALAPEREPVIVLTAPWHERDTQALVGPLGAAVFAPPPDTAQDLIDKYGITAEQAGDGSRAFSGFGAAARTSTGMRPATGFRPGSTRTLGESTTTACCGRRVSARSSRATHSPTPEPVSRCAAASPTSRSSRDCGRYSTCQSRWRAQRTARLQTALRSSALSL
jgi:hypothetical protein